MLRSSGANSSYGYDSVQPPLIPDFLSVNFFYMKNVAVACGWYDEKLITNVLIYYNWEGVSPKNISC